MDKTKQITPPDGGYGWIIVLATTLINISVLPLVQCFGIIYQNEFKILGITAAETSFLLHLHSAIYCSLGLLSSPLLKKYDFRRVALLGTFLMCTGIFFTSFGKSYGILICTFSVLLGVGQGIMLPATYVATNTYFKKRLTLAVSFSVTGASISNIIMPQVCYKLMAHFQNTTNTVLVLAAMSLVAIACCFLLKPLKKRVEINDETMNNLNEPREITESQKNPEKKDELELLNCVNNEQIYKETTLPVVKKSFITKIYQLFNLELLNDRPFVIAIIGMAISFASELNIILMMSFMLPELASFNKREVALALSIQSIADVIGRLVIPLLGHYFNVSPRIMYANSLITSTVGRTVMAIFYDSPHTIYFCASLVGLAKGIKAVYQSVIIPKFVPLEKLPAANGLSMLLTGTASLVIGTIIGAVRDISHSYIYALHSASILSMSCVALWAIHFIVYERKAPNEEHIN